jgi:hypothetical protein
LLVFLLDVMVHIVEH